MTTLGWYEQQQENIAAMNAGETPPHSTIEDPDGEIDERYRFDPDTAKHGYINIYLIDRRYGGPEEGGWWYTDGEPYASIPFETPEEREQFADQWDKQLLELNKGRRDISSVLSTGQYALRVEDHFATYFPLERPRYE